MPIPPCNRLLLFSNYHYIQWFEHFRDIVRNLPKGSTGSGRLSCAFKIASDGIAKSGSVKSGQIVGAKVLPVITIDKGEKKKVVPRWCISPKGVGAEM